MPLAVPECVGKPVKVEPEDTIAAVIACFPAPALLPVPEDWPDADPYCGDAPPSTARARLAALRKNLDAAVRQHQQDCTVYERLRRCGTAALPASDLTCMAGSTALARALTLKASHVSHWLAVQSVVKREMADLLRLAA